MTQDVIQCLDCLAVLPELLELLELNHAKDHPIGAVGAVREWSCNAKDEAQGLAHTEPKTHIPLTISPILTTHLQAESITSSPKRTPGF